MSDSGMIDANIIRNGGVRILPFNWHSIPKGEPAIFGEQLLTNARGEVIVMALVTIEVAFA